VHANASKKLKLRVMPLMFVLSFISYLDRTNLAFVADDLQSSLSLSDKKYALGAGFFFLTYSSMQVPSNGLLKMFGGVPWLSLLAILWGTATCCMAFIENATSYYSVRALLGLFEAGFYVSKTLLLCIYLRFYFSFSSLKHAPPPPPSPLPRSLELSSTCARSSPSPTSASFTPSLCLRHASRSLWAAPSSHLLNQSVVTWHQTTTRGARAFSSREV
jgi:hypothetical protein